MGHPPESDNSDGASSEVETASDVAAGDQSDGWVGAGEPGLVPPPSQVAFVDSSALVALVDRDDASHTAVVAAYRDLVATGYRFFTTDYVVTETFDLLRAGLGATVARQWLRDCRLAVYHVDEGDVANARRLVLERANGSALSLTDAISLVVMDRLGVTDAFAVDQRVLGELA